FRTGCATNKIPEKKAERIFNVMEEFAGYGFNKSHSCAYALLAYQTAYLKTHQPVELTGALLTSEAGNTEKVVKYINEARGMSIAILPPDGNDSDRYVTPGGVRRGRANAVSTACSVPLPLLHRRHSNCARLPPGVRRDASPANTPCSASTSPATRLRNMLRA